MDVFSLLENPRIYFENKYNDELIEYFLIILIKIFLLKNFYFNIIFLTLQDKQELLEDGLILDKKNKNNYYSKYFDVTIKRLKKSLIT